MGTGRRRRHAIPVRASRLGPARRRRKQRQGLLLQRQGKLGRKLRRLRHHFRRKIDLRECLHQRALQVRRTVQGRQQLLLLSAVRKLLAVALICAPVAAEASRLTLRVVAPGAVRVALHRADLAAPPIERDLQPGDASVELPDGTWRLDASRAGLWHKRQYVTVPAGATMEVRLWPAATVAGEIALAGGKDWPDQLTIRFEVRDGPSSDETCAVAAKRFACTIPAGTADLAL